MAAYVSGINKILIDLHSIKLQNIQGRSNLTARWDEYVHASFIIFLILALILNLCVNV